MLLAYRAGDFNRLHQDTYGEIAFPFQSTAFLNRPVTDYEGGEFVLLEQRARMQNSVEVIVPALGEIVIFPNRERPVPSSACAGRFVRAAVRHGVSRVRSGERMTLGIIFHDAR